MVIWVPIVTSVAALVLSLMTWFQVQRAPEIRMDLPSITRIAGSDFHVYLQPSFIVPRQYEATARIRSVRLELTRDGAVDSRAPVFYWRESGRFERDEQGLTNFTYAADPGPFIVGPDEPEQPILDFHATNGLISPGRWNGVLTATRDDGEDPLVRHFCVEVTEANMADYEPPDDHFYIDFRSDIPGGSGCYSRPADF